MPAPLFLAALLAMTEPVSEPSGPGDATREELFPIREVSRLTGINPVTLRAWERRYGLIQPTRTESGHRLYSRADIDEVRSILGWIERGVAVSKVGRILANNQQGRRDEPAAKRIAEQGEHTEWQVRLKRVARGFDDLQLEQLYGQIFSSYPVAVVFQDILMPVWQELMLHQDGFGQASEWAFFDAFLRARTAQRLQMVRHQGQDCRVLLMALPEQCRELELLVAGLLLGSARVSVQVLGIGSPLDELTLVCDKLAPAAAVLYSNHMPAADLPRRLTRLGQSLECPLLLAGEMSEMAQDALVDTAIPCLGSDGRLMQRRLQQYLEGHLDS